MSFLEIDKKIGYGFLKSALNLPVFEPNVTASLSSSVRKITHKDNQLWVPTRYRLSSDDYVSHVLFALKHEGINLQILSLALSHIQKDDVLAAFRKKPTGIYQRQLGFLWEYFNQKTLEVEVPSNARYVTFFDEKRYVTTKGVRNKKWRVIFNGLGSLVYCPVVDKTERIQAHLKDSVLKRFAAYLSDLDDYTSERAMQWAYASEAESNYAIEGEMLEEDELRGVIHLLELSHKAGRLTDQDFYELHNQMMRGRGESVTSYRKIQNWLTNGDKGALGVSYVPPSPDTLKNLMNGFLEMANTLPKQVHPVIAASVTSFGFVFLHPFMDGNGRLSRFLFHQQLCLSGQMQKGQLLPISLAMKASEAKYLAALQAFSKPARALWSMQLIARHDYDFRFDGSDAIYRYWDATQCVEFGLEMAEEALNTHLRHEVNDLMCFDAVRRAVNDRYDVRETILHHLINGCLDLNGVVSKNLRKRYADRVDEVVFDFIETEAKKALEQYSA